MPLKVFFTSVSCNRELKKHQERLFSVLDSKAIKYEAVDISQDAEVKNLMRKLANNPEALAPQICNGNDYCGDYGAFHNAVENGNLETFLKI